MARPDQHAQADAPAEQLASSQQLNSKQRRKLLRQQQRQQQSQATMSGASPAAKPGPPNRAGQPLAEPAAIEAAPAAAPAVPEGQPPADPVTQAKAALQQLVASKRAVNHQMNQLTGHVVPLVFLAAVCPCVRACACEVRPAVTHSNRCLATA